MGLGALDVAVGEYLGLIGDPVATLARAVEAEPGLILGHTTIAALNCLGGVPGHAAPVRESLAAANAAAEHATAQERLHLAAANAWAAGDIAGAAAFWERAVAEAPEDILALRLAHDTHFFLGASAKLRDVPAGALPAYAPGSRSRGFVLGMAAFGLEEMGEYAAAEHAGREAVEINPADVWGVHAVAHVLEMQDRPEEGVRWLRGLEPHWAPALGLAVHQWWHLALYLIELGRIDEVLALYDARMNPAPGAMVLDLVDAAALLWRLELLGVEVGARWEALAPVWAEHAQEHVLMFNDLHIAMTLRGEAAAAHEAAVRAYAAAGDGTNQVVSRELGLAVMGALRAFREGDYAGTVALLAPVYQRLAPVGGSHAQRDLVIQTLGVAAARAGQVGVLKEVAAARGRLKRGLPRAWIGLV